MVPPPCSYSSTAVEHLSRGYERLTQLRALLLSSSSAKFNSMQAIGLLDKALRCVAATLSELQTNSPSQIEAAVAAAAVEDCKNVIDPYKRRRRIQAWTIVTSVPHFDGHQWRKYGQKRIHRSEFPRSYYKCTHSKDQGCLATKTIQQKDEEISNPPKYVVSYSMQHTCKAIETHDIPFVMDSSAIINSTSSTTASSTCSSHELSTSACPAASPDQPPALPSQVADIEVCLMESMLLSTEPRGEVNGAESSSMMSPLAALDFDWDWLMSRSGLENMMME